MSPRLCVSRKFSRSTCRRPAAIVNLDPANDTLPYECAVNICDLIQLNDVAESFDLGPNGGGLYDDGTSIWQGYDGGMSIDRFVKSTFSDSSVAAQSEETPDVVEATAFDGTNIWVLSNSMNSETLYKLTPGGGGGGGDPEYPGDP